MLEALINILTSSGGGGMTPEQAQAIKEQQEREQRQIKRLKSFFVASVAVCVALSAIYLKKKVM